MGIVQMSISAGALIIAVTVIRSVALNRLPKTIFLVLWGVILLRLFVPVSIPLPFGTFSAVNESILNVSHSIQSGGFLPGTTPPINRPSAAAHEMAALPYPLDPAATAQNVNVIRLIWFSGMLAIFVYFTFIFLRSYRKLRFALPVGNEEFWGKWLARHKLLRPIAIMLSDRITSPIAAGVIRPRIILPQNIDLNNTQLLSHVLTHEYYHIKRGDALLKMFLVFALCVHWFNPLVWIMFVLANRDLELTCDEAVVRHFGMETKEAYAYSIIDMAEHRSAFTPFFSGFTKNAAEERIESIMKMKRASIPSWGIALVLAAVLTVGAFSTADAAPQTDEFALPISVPQAREIALSFTGGGTISGLELISDVGRGLVYRIVIVNDAARYEVSLNARTGDIFRLTVAEAADMLALDIAWIGGDAVQPPLNQPRLDEAASAALAIAGGGTVRHICLDWERGVAVYHVRVYRNGSRIDYHLDRGNLAVVGEYTRQHNSAFPSSSSFRLRQMDVIPTISFNQAGAIALAYMGGGIVREVSRSYVGDRPAFDVDITVNGQRWCFYIDIHTGQILRYYRE